MSQSYLPKGWSPNKMVGSAFTNQFKQENWVGPVAQRYSCNQADPILFLEVISERTTIPFIR